MNIIDQKKMPIKWMQKMVTHIRITLFDYFTYLHFFYIIYFIYLLQSLHLRQYVFVTSYKYAGHTQFAYYIESKICLYNYRIFCLTTPIIWHNFRWYRLKWIAFINTGDTLTTLIKHLPNLKNMHIFDQYRIIDKIIYMRNKANANT